VDDEVYPEEPDGYFGPREVMKRLRFVSFPSVHTDGDGNVARHDRRLARAKDPGEQWETDGVVQTLDIPEELISTASRRSTSSEPGCGHLVVKEGRYLSYTMSDTYQTWNVPRDVVFFVRNIQPTRSLK